MNGYFATAYAFLLAGALKDLAAQKAKQNGQPPVLGTFGTDPRYSLSRAPVPRNVLPGEHQQAMMALQRAGNAVLSGGTLHTVRNIDERVAYIRKQIRKDSLKPAVVEAARTIVSQKCGTRGNARWCLNPKEYAAEVKAIYQAVQDPRSPIAMRYVRDHATVDQFTAADKLMRLRAGDCFVKGTFVFRDDHQLVPIESLRVGDRIWGLDKWTRVENTWEKGILPTVKIRLNNGSPMRLTDGHKVYVARCKRHVSRLKSSACSCSVAERNVERIYVKELRKGDVLLRPDRIPFGQGTMDPDRALVEGLYLSDGWCEPTSNRFAISGRDGHPKEKQKGLVKLIAERMGLVTYWHKRYIRVRDAEWTARLSTMGTHAPQKRALSIDLDEGAAIPLLDGILADAGRNTHGKGRTFTTTSRTLFLQTRVLAKMAGITCGERYIVDHGGLGTNPIWRLQLWGASQKAEKLLRVTEVIRDEVALPCFDIATEDHYVWLPEADWTVSNCDDGSILLGALLTSIGYPIRLRVIQDSNNASWSHIYLLVGMPPQNPTIWAPLDWSVYPFKPAGWQAPGADESARTGRPAGVVTRVKDFNV